MVGGSLCAVGLVRSGEVFVMGGEVGCKTFGHMASQGHVVVRWGDGKTLKKKPGTSFEIA